MLELAIDTVCLMVGSATVAVGAILARQGRSRSARPFMGLASTFVLLQAALWTRALAGLAARQEPLPGDIAFMLGLSRVADLSGSAILVLVLPAFTAGLFRLPLPRWLSRASLPLALATGFGPLAGAAGLAAARIILYGTSAGTIGFALYASRRLRADGEARYLARILGGLGALFFPVFVLELAREPLGFGWPREVELLSLPAFMLGLGVAFLAFAFKAYGAPPREPGPPRAWLSLHGITGAESDVVALLDEGLTYKEIASRLGIAYKTVDNQVQAIYRKTGVGNRMALLASMRGKPPRGP